MVKVAVTLPSVEGNMANESTQPIVLQTAEAFRAEAAEPIFRPRPPAGHPGLWAISFASAFSLFWLGSCAAYLFGYYGVSGLLALPLQQQVLLGILAGLPPILFVSAAWTLSRGIALSRSAEALAEAAERLFTADDTSARTAARLGRAVRRELDGLNAGLDGAFARLRALETILEEQIAAVDEAGARIGVQTEAAAARLTQERERLEGIGAGLTDSAARAGEIVAGRAAQLRATMESAEGALKTAGQSLETQAQYFRQAANMVAEAPRNAAVELDTQAKRIESVSDAAMARAEFVLGRQERHRTAMGDLLQRLKEESTAYESSLAAQRAAIERAIGALQSDSQRFDLLAGETDRQVEAIMQGASARTVQLSQACAREIESLRNTADSSNAALTRIVDALREAGTGAQALIAETTGQARNDAKSLVGEAMVECERLLRAAGEMSIETGAIRQTLAKSVEEIERHILNLPVLAQQEAQRVREMVRSETEEMLDHSARTLSTIHARSIPRALQRPAQDPQPQQSADADGLRGLARRLTQRSAKKPAEPSSDIRQREQKSWEMSTLLAAADTAEQAHRDLSAGSAAAIGALQAALADLAIDLDAIGGDVEPLGDGWKRYLAGDRAIFARRIAETIDETAVDRIAAHYRDDSHFREAANTYLADFEALLSRVRNGDGNGLLVSSVLSADTGKIYLAMAYALGRL